MTARKIAQVVLVRIFQAHDVKRQAAVLALKAASAKRKSGCKIAGAAEESVNGEDTSAAELSASSSTDMDA